MKSKLVCAAVGLLLPLLLFSSVTAMAAIDPGDAEAALRALDPRQWRANEVRGALRLEWSTRRVFVPGVSMVPQRLQNGRFVDLQRSGVETRFPGADEPVYDVSMSANDIPGVFRLRIETDNGNSALTGPVTIMQITEASPAVMSQAEDVSIEAAGPALPVEGDRVKIEIETDGLYLLGASDIAAALANTTEADVQNWIGATNLALSVGGVDVSWWPLDGTAIVFYAEGYADTYTGRNVYWLDPGPGMLMNVSTTPAPAVSTSGQWYWHSDRYETNAVYVPSLAGDVGDDFWVNGGSGQSVFMFTRSPTQLSDSETSSVVLDSVNVSQPWQAFVSLFSNTDFAAEIDHRARLSQNGFNSPLVEWGGEERIIISGVATNAVEGINEVSVTTYAVPEVSFSVAMLDWVGVRYARYLIARDGDLFAFENRSYSDVTVQAMNSGTPWVLDVTEPRVATLVTNLLIEPSAGQFDISFGVPSPTSRVVLASSPVAPVSVSGVVTNDWLTPAHQADMVVIAPASLTNAMDELVAYRAEQGLELAVVPYEAIVDQWNQGFASPDAIRSFLSEVTQQAVSGPEMVLLVGAGNVDFRDFYAHGDSVANLIPPACIIAYDAYSATSQRQFGSDSPLVDFDDDGVPDLAIGRWPVRNAAEVTNMTQKTITYESDFRWHTNVLFVADDKDEGGDFSASSDAIAAQISADVSTEKLYLDDYIAEVSAANPSDPNPLYQATLNLRSAQFASLNQGVGMHFYMGHATRTVMASQPYIMRQEDVALFTNETRPFVSVAMTCELNDVFEPSYKGERDSLIRGIFDLQGGGCVASFAPVSQSYNNIGQQIAGKLIETIHSKQATRLGAATLYAIEDYAAGPTVPGPYFAHLWRACQLLGDPALIVAPYPPTYADWRRQWFGRPGTPGAENGEGNADPDGDQHINSEEFLFGSDPSDGSSAHGMLLYPTLHRIETNGSSTSRVARVAFDRRLSTLPVTYEFDVTYDLVTGSWRSNVVDFAEFAVETNGFEMGRSVFEYAAPETNSTAPLFIRGRALFE